MSDSIRTASEFVEYSDKLSAERKKRDQIDIKIRKIVETNPPIDVCDEQRRIDHWTQVIGQNNQQYDKKILIYKEQISMYERLIENATIERDKPDFRPRYELKKAQQDLELKKNYKPKELQKLEIDLEVIDKKIESFKNLLGIGMNKPEVPVEKKKTITPSPSPPSSNQEKSVAPKVMRGKKVVPVENTQEAVERPDTPVPEPIEFVTLPEPTPAKPTPVINSFVENGPPTVIQNTKVLRAKKIVPSA
jgi:hypothetical protein